MKILVTPTSLQPGSQSKALEVLQSYSDDLVFNPAGRPLTEDELIPLLKDCDGYIAGLDFVTEKVISSCSRLKVISRYGAGYDRVDIQAAKKKGILVTNTPGVNAEAVGELAMALILSAARKVTHLNETTRGGEWLRSTGMELKNKTIGIMGLGSIGKVVARCAKGFEMNVAAYDPYINEAYCKEHKIQVCTFDELLEISDIISLHLPLLDTTRHLIGKDAFSKMKPNAILVNTSRGGIVDEDAACEALKSGHLGGLGLDAFEVEPPRNTSLFEFPNVVATPHTGAHTKEATSQMAAASVRNLIDVLEGKDCLYVVNK